MVKGAAAGVSSTQPGSGAPCSRQRQRRQRSLERLCLGAAHVGQGTEPEIGGASAPLGNVALVVGVEPANVVSAPVGGNALVCLCTECVAVPAFQAGLVGGRLWVPVGGCAAVGVA